MNDRPQNRLMRAPRDGDRESAPHADAGAHYFARAFDLVHRETSRGLAVKRRPFRDRAGVWCVGVSHSVNRVRYWK